MDRFLTTLVVFISALGQLGVLGYEVCERFTSTTFTYCDDGKYCCHNKQDCCSNSLAGWAIAVIIGGISVAVSVIVYCVFRRRRLRLLAAAQQAPAQGYANPTVLVSSSQSTMSSSYPQPPPPYAQQ